MLRPLVVIVLVLHLLSPTLACTAYVLHQAGRTFVGNNEDSWCVNGRVRFVPGAAGRFGAVYFSSWLGHPYIPWMDQLGMNEAGLVFDGLTVQPKDVAPTPGKPALEFNELNTRMLEHCRDVPEAVAFLQAHDLILLHKSMIFLADAQGRYAVVQNDTILLGEEPYFAVGNWRLDGGTDMDAIPIPRLQQGRALLKAGVAPTVDGAWSVLESMQSCRKFLENGTFFSTLFEPDSGKVHVGFYHDYDHRITFDLRAELQKGEHTLDLPSLFPPNKAYQALQAYRTPFHERWLFWSLAGWALLAMLIGMVSGALVLWRSAQRLFGANARPLLGPLLLGTGTVLCVVLIAFLLTNESIYYFGLGDVHPLLAVLPWAMVLLLVASFIHMRRAGHRISARLSATLMLPLLVLLGYWGMLFG